MAKREIERPDVKPVVSGSVKKKEKGIIESFVKEDAKTIVSEVKDEILIPTLRDMIFNGLRAGLEKLLYGESSGNYYRGGNGGPRRAGSTNYNNMYSNYGPAPKKANPRNRYEVETIIFDSMPDVDNVLECLEELMSRYQQFTIADYYRAAGVEFESTDYNYGWYSMTGIAPVKVRDGWTINFPKAVPMED